MDFYSKYKSPLGYQTGENQIDSYGVDHSGFTLRDEIAYQMARQQRENQIIKNYNNQGITQDYPQSGNNFWGNSPDNNFGFGSSQISSNIENMQNTPVLNVQNQTQNFKQQVTDVPLTQNNNAYLDFNGQELRWHQNNEVTNSWKAMSGKPDYQCKEYDSVKDKGPLPEGKWLVRQSQHQNYDQTQTVWDKLKNNLGKGRWPGGKDSWGNNRIWLEPAQGTDNKNRTGISIHGGKEYGSGGCIDLTDKMDEFTNKFKKYGHDMILNVKYDKDCW